MDSTLDQRITRLVDRRRTSLAAARAGDRTELDRRFAHDRVVGELPRLTASIAGAVADLNDRIAEAGLRIVLNVADKTPAAEAIHTLRVLGASDDGPALVFTVDYLGDVRALLNTRRGRTVLRTTTVFDLDQTAVMELLVDLLETQVP